MHLYIIAGSDPTGGAGIGRDICTANDFGCTSGYVITSVTAQHTGCFTAAESVSPSMIEAQCDAISAEAPAHAVKIGMLHHADNITALLPLLYKMKKQHIPIICDPLCISTSGGELLDTPGRMRMMRDIIPLCTLVTPNVVEARQLTGEADALACGNIFLRKGADSVLITGGDECIGDASVTDTWIRAGKPPRHFSHTRIPGGEKTRGTGCMLSTAIACVLARSASLENAIIEARGYVKRQIARQPERIM